MSHVIVSNHVCCSIKNYYGPTDRSTIVTVSVSYHYISVRLVYFVMAKPNTCLSFSRIKYTDSRSYNIFYWHV